MKKMFRKLLVLCLALMMLCSSAMACTEADAAQDALNKVLYTMVDAANAQVKVLVKIAQETPQNDVDLLIKATNAVVAPVYAYAELIGATVECEYDYYEVDGQIVAIDPLKVINVRQTLALPDDDE